MARHSWPSLHRQAGADRFVNRQRPQRYVIPDPAEHGAWLLLHSRYRASVAMTAVDAILAPPFEYRMLGNDNAPVYDAIQIRQLLDLDHPPGPVRHAVVIAPTATSPSWLIRRFSFRTALKRCSGKHCSSACSSVNASETTRWVVRGSEHLPRRPAIRSAGH